jgi:hypothetical protein
VDPELVVTEEELLLKMIPKKPEGLEIPTYNCPNTQWESEIEFPNFD